MYGILSTMSSYVSITFNFCLLEPPHLRKSIIIEVTHILSASIIACIILST